MERGVALILIGIGILADGHAVRLGGQVVVLRVRALEVGARHIVAVAEAVGDK